MLAVTYVSLLFQLSVTSWNGFLCDSRRIYQFREHSLPTVFHLCLVSGRQANSHRVIHEGRRLHFHSSIVIFTAKVLLFIFPKGFIVHSLTNITYLNLITNVGCMSFSKASNLYARLYGY